MAEKKPLPTITKKSPHSRPPAPTTRGGPRSSLTGDHDPSEAKTIQDYFPTGDLEERAPAAPKGKPAAPKDGGDDGFVMDFDEGAAPPVRRR